MTQGSSAEGPARHPSILDSLARAAAFAVLYAACILASHLISAGTAGPLTFWFPSGLFLVGFLLAPPPQWPILALLSLPVHVLMGRLLGAPPVLNALSWAATCLCTCATAAVVRRMLPARDWVESLQSAALVGTFAVAASAVIASFGLLAAAAFPGSARVELPLVSLWFLRWMANAGGMLLLAPPLLALASPARGPSRKPRQVMEAVVLIGGTLALAYLVFSGMEETLFGLSFLVMLPILVLSFRHGLRAVGLVDLLVAGMAAAFTTHGKSFLAGPGVPLTQGFIAMQVFLCLASATAVGICIVSQENRANTDALRDSRARLLAVFQEAPLGIAIVDGDTGSILQVNRTMCELLGRTEQELLATTYAALTHRDDVTLVEAHRADLRRRTVDSYEMDARGVRPDGRPIWLNFHVTRLRGTADGRDLHLALAADLTQRRRSERVQRAQQQKLMHAAGLATLGSLVAGVTSEVNSPNHAILLGADVLQRLWKDLVPVLDDYRRTVGGFSAAGMPLDELTRTVPGCIDGIRAASNQISAVVAGLKAFADMEAHPAASPVDVNEVVRSAVALVQNRLDAATSRFSLQLDGAAPPVLGDFARLEQAVIHLLQNACLALESRDAGIRVATAGRDGRVEIIVRDEGVGMGEKTLANVRRPFFTTRRREGAIGLGATFAASIAEAHGGDITWESAPRAGTTVTILLPPIHPPSKEEPA
jgi:PAS domain S-box-containing protein